MSESLAALIAAINRWCNVTDHDGYGADRPSLRMVYEGNLWWVTWFKWSAHDEDLGTAIDMLAAVLVRETP